MLPLTYSPLEPAFSNGVSAPFLSKRLNTWSEWSPPPARCVDCTHTSFRWCLNRSYSLPCGFLYPGKGFSDQTPGAPTSSAASRLFRSALLRSAPVPPVEVRDALGALPRDDPAPSCFLASPTFDALAFSPGLPASRPPRVSRRSSFFAGLSLFASPPTPGGGGLYTSGALRSRLVATGAALMSSCCSCLISAAVSGSRSAPKNPGSGAGGAEGVPRVERPIAAASDTSFPFPAAQRHRLRGAGRRTSHARCQPPIRRRRAIGDRQASGSGRRRDSFPHARGSRLLLCPERLSNPRSSECGGKTEKDGALPTLQSRRPRVRSFDRAK
jgi:hypothetical protein